MSEMSRFKISAFCPMCKAMMKGGPKTNSIYFKWNVCMGCFIEFIEGREEKWTSGWRPTPEQVEKLLKKLYP